MNITAEFTLLGENINTDQIISGQYLRTTNTTLWSQKIFEVFGQEVMNKVQSRPLIVGGRNFGCGSSREQAALALKGCGIKAIIAPSFAMIFYRNCINNGVIPVRARKLSDFFIVDTMPVSLDLSQSKLFIGNHEITIDPISPFIIDLVNSEGLLNYYEKNGKIRL